MKKRTKRFLQILVVLMALAAGAVGLGSTFMLHYSLGYAPEARHTAEWQMQRIRSECPWTAVWMDSISSHHALRDTMLVMPSGHRAHALLLDAPRPTTRTAVVVHGYKVRAEGMLHIAYLYHHDLQANVLLPDLYGHGQSEGDHIQMGWLDRLDVMRWAEVADEAFARRLPESGQHHRHTQVVLHGISMGAATVMCVAGEPTPDYVKAFVEDCGYTGVWQEFEAQLHDQFGLPGFPLMQATSALCRWKYGWSFGEASALKQVARSTKPMLFIHGDRDDFVPFAMLRPLYEAKTHGRKDSLVAHGSVHAMAYRDHHERYTRRVRQFLAPCWGEE